MKLLFTNTYNEINKDEQKQVSIEIKGKCDITNYNPNKREYDKEKGDLFVEITENGVNVKGNKQTNDCVKLNNNKYSVFMAIAGMEENINNTSGQTIAPVELTFKDLELARNKGLEKIKTVLRANSLTFKEIAFDPNKGILRINYTNSNGVEEILRISISKDTESEQAYLPKEINLLGESGVKITPELFEGKTISKKDLPSQLAKLFDIYNTNNEGKSKNILDENELKDLYADICNIDTLKKRDKILQPSEIKLALSAKNLNNEIGVNDFLNFLNQIFNISKSKEISSTIEQKNLEVKQLLNDITTDNITSFVKNYGSVNGNNIVKDIYKNRNRGVVLNNLKDLISQRAEECGVEQTIINEFRTDYANIVNSKDRESTKISKLNDYINKFIDSFSKEEKLYNENKECIINMLAGNRAEHINGHKNQRPNEELCFSTDDLNVVIKNIMTYAQLNNPRNYVIEQTKSDNVRIKKLAEDLLDSGYLDYYPVFVAAIIAEETQFRETNNEHGKIYTSNGRGAMQLTSAIPDDIFTNPKSFDKEFVARIKKGYSDSTGLYKAIKEISNIQLNYDVGTAALRSKLYYAFKDSTKSGTQINSPTTLMQAVAMHYNNNKRFYQKATQPKMYEYCENVIQRFKQYTPNGIKVGSFYKYSGN